MKAGLRLLLITLPLVALGAGALVFVVATGVPPERTALGERATAVRVITAATAPITPRLVGFGLVSPARTFEAIAQVGGTVEYVNPNLRKGAILPVDAVLVRLSPIDFNLAIAQANANIRAAEARLKELAVSEANLTSALAIETEALALKAAELLRAETLYAAATITQAVLDSARAGHLAQRQKVQSAESALALLPTQRAVQTEQIAVYKATLETAKLNLARSEMSLPFTARVASVDVEAGQYLSVGQTAAVLDGVDAAEVEARVPIAALRTLMETAGTGSGTMAVDLSAITAVLRGMGLSAEVRLRLGDEVLAWPAQVDRISDTIDPQTGTLGVIVRVEAAYSAAEPGKRPPLTKGMFVEVVLRSQPLTGIPVPRSALREGAVLIADADDRLRRTAVTVRLTQDDLALVSGGLADGDRVVVSAPSPVIEGMLLMPADDTALVTRLVEAAAE